MGFRIMNDSSLSLEGVGKVVSAAGGGMGFLGPGCPPPMRAEAEEPGRGLMGPNLPPDMVDPARGRGPGGPIPRGPGGPRWLGPGIGRLLLGGGVIARRVTGSAYGMTNALESGS